jgi:hypothetical protein
MTRGNNLLRYGKAAETAAASATASGSIEPVERFNDDLTFLFRDTGTIVVDEDLNLHFFAFQQNQAMLREVEGISGEVLEQPAQNNGVSNHNQRLGRIGAPPSIPARVQPVSLRCGMEIARATANAPSRKTVISSRSVPRCCAGLRLASSRI